MNGPCDDIRVLDLSSGPAGGIATLMAADYRAGPQGAFSWGSREVALSSG